MAKTHPLDLRIAIAELFDSRQCRGETPLDEIIAKSGAASPQSARNALKVLDFTKVKPRTPSMQSIAARWQPPRKLPELNGRHKPLTHAVHALFASGQIKGRCSAPEIAPLVSAPENSVGQVLRALKFKKIAKGYKKRVGWVSETWTPPRSWPALFQEQRRLRQRYQMKPEAIMRVSDAAANLDNLIKDAINTLNYDRNGPRVDDKGVLKAEIQKTIQRMYNFPTGLGRRDVPALELAQLLNMKSTAGPDRLLAEVGNLLVPDPAESQALNALSRLDENTMRNCLRIMARQPAREDAMGPAAFALRWATENIGVA